ncbi:DUF4251 domain-containing protein [uncultured Bacteroides sp.]|uniref:DUF4251 domain-containing protein n=1 Tax=uncultured Bacteroides sp. TaxID=162156 RepID=UPI002AA87469|nr:DUF4251 domain-containing protein [uncultured Bacteroides sp.]
MKTNKSMLVLPILLVANLQPIFAQSKQKTKNECEQTVKQLIELKSYCIDVNLAIPRRSSSLYLTSPYSLKVKNDSVFSWLPYYGRAYTIPYGGGQGLTFKAPIENYKLKYNKKGTAKINFIARSKEDLFRFSLTIYPLGSSSIDVNMQNRESISFSGDLKLNK